MSMLETVQRFCKRRNLDIPTTVLGSTDPQIRQILAMLEEEGNELSGRGEWEQLTFEAEHTTVATESQGEMTTIADNGYRYIKFDTIWDRTSSEPIPVLSGTEWQQLKSGVMSGPNYQVRIRGGELLSTPVPAAGDTWVFEYVTWNWILGADGTTYSQYFNLDTDTFLLPEPILLMGLTWRWKKEKGLSYAEDFNAYERMVKDTLSRNGAKGRVNLGIKRHSPSPSILVNDGDWPL